MRKKIRTEEILKVVEEQAINGDMTAARLLLERSLPALRPVDTPIVLPIGDSLADVGRSILEAVSAGRLTPVEGSTLFERVVVAWARDRNQRTPTAYRGAGEAAPGRAPAMSASLKLRLVKLERQCPTAKFPMDLSRLSVDDLRAIRRLCGDHVARHGRQHPYYGSRHPRGRGRHRRPRRIIETLIP